TYRKKPVRIQESIIGIFLRTEKDAIAYYQSPYIITTEVLQQNALEPVPIISYDRVNSYNLS
ncbi:hypothetical protein, partial [Crocosphaera watsonii]|uniref:hypothetical protein n=1 Tax=Crocosphaera watsonii TaxID=263511 RepID=UPI0030DA4A2B